MIDEELNTIGQSTSQDIYILQDEIEKISQDIKLLTAKKCDQSIGTSVVFDSAKD